MALSNKRQLRLAFVGKSRAGKDTLARELGKHYRENGKTVVTHAFADGIKNIYEQYFGDLAISSKPRDAYITIGESFRSIDPSVWVKQLARKVNESYQWDVIMVTDLRREVELEYLRQEGFTIIGVSASDEVRVARSEALGETLDLANRGDEEVDLIKPDLRIANDIPLTKGYIEGIVEVIAKEFYAHEKPL